MTQAAMRTRGNAVLVYILIEGFAWGARKQNYSLHVWDPRSKMTSIATLVLGLTELLIICKGTPWVQFSIFPGFC